MYTPAQRIPKKPVAHAYFLLEMYPHPTGLFILALSISAIIHHAAGCYAVRISEIGLSLASEICLSLISEIGLLLASLIGLSLDSEIGLSLGSEIGLSHASLIRISLGSGVGLSLGSEIGLSLASEIGLLLASEIVSIVCFSNFCTIILQPASLVLLQSFS